MKPNQVLNIEMFDSRQVVRINANYATEDNVTAIIKNLTNGYLRDGDISVFEIVDPESEYTP